MEIYSSLPLASLAPLRSSSNELIFTGLMVAIGQPREVQPGEWACPFTIDGIPEPRSDRGLGIDGVSALLNALHAIRFALEASGVRVSWEGGEPGGRGVPEADALRHRGRILPEDGAAHRRGDPEARGREECARGPVAPG
ncbi:uncharacterized protein SOCE836_034320 [Sorangium cellulosum]|uniref:DUF6968 domain-containing protein n=1 Tax=Sorangium cellulosum TaxID=56 RepID=A0A4P2QP79_SORCE|nr:uncharacterized protein SOCE836_034320 [Sorangium cellulosum]